MGFKGFYTKYLTIFIIKTCKNDVLDAFRSKIFSPAARVYVAYHNDIKSERELELIAIVNSIILRMILRASTICKSN